MHTFHVHILMSLEYLFFLGSVGFILFRGCWLFVFAPVRFCLLLFVYFFKHILTKQTSHFSFFDSNMGKAIYFFP